MTTRSAARRLALAAAVLAGGLGRAFAALCPMSANTSACAGNYIYVTQTCTTGIQPSTSTISAALAELSLNAGPACVIIEDTATYAEQVVVSGFNNGGSTVTIEVDPGAGGLPILSPISSGTAALLISNSNVVVQGLRIVPNNALSYGVLSSSPNVVLNDVVLNDPLQEIQTAGVSLSSDDLLTFSTVSAHAPVGLYLAGTSNVNVSDSYIADSSATVSAVDGVLLQGASGTTISYSTVTSCSLDGAALAVSGSTDNAVTNSTLDLSPNCPDATDGQAALMIGGYDNSVSVSSMIVNIGSGGTALFVTDSSDTFTDDFIADPAGQSALIQDALYGTISLATIDGSSATAALSIVGSTGILVNQSNIISANGDALDLEDGQSNSVLGSTITASSAGNDALLVADPYNDVVSADVISNSAGQAVLMMDPDGPDDVPELNAVSSCSISGAGPLPTLEISDASSDTVSASVVSNAALGPGVQIDSGSAGVTIARSQVQGSTAVYLSGASATTLDGDTLTGSASGAALFIDGASAGSAIAGATVSGGGYGVFLSSQPVPTLSVDSLDFASLSAGSTAFYLAGGVLVSTFSGVQFSDPNISVNVNASGLLPGSAVTMASPSGVRAGPSYAVDPSDFVQWPQAAINPTSSILSPIGGVVIDTFSVIQGTAAAFGSAAISSVAVTVQDLGSGLYWNGVSFSSPTAVSTAAAVVGYATGTWSVSIVPVNGRSYRITSQAFDTLGDFQPSLAVATFTFDDPASTITVPSPGAALPALASIQGTAVTLDAAAAISSVTVTVKDLATGLYWNGGAFLSTCPVPGQASISGSAWTYSNAVSTSWVSGHSYGIHVRAFDTIGGAQLGVSSATFLFDNTPPVITITFPLQGGVYTSIPNLTGTSTDNVEVATMSVQIQRLGSSPACYDPADNSFDAACGPASFMPAQASTASWSYTAPIPWASGGQYLVTARGVDEAGNQTIVANAFTFQASTTLAAGTPADGEGSALLAPPSAAGCQLITATATYVAGPLGVASGGIVALHVPNGWTPPQGASPGQPGFAQALSTTGFTLQFNPPQLSSVTLGSNWVVYFATSGLSPGQPVQFFYTGFPPAGPAAQLPQVFGFDSQGGPGGLLTALSTSPAMGLSAGTPAALAFAPPAPLALGPLQPSPTMQVELTDACGAVTAAPLTLPVSLQAQVSGSTDTQAQFFDISGATLSAVSIQAGQTLSPFFSFNSSTAGVALEDIVAQAVLSSVPISAVRAVQRLASAPSIGAASVDAGTPGTSTTTTITQGSVSSGQAFINFTLSNPSLGWEVVISSQPSFASKVADLSGAGNPGRSLTWNGQNLSANPPQYVSPGVYYVEIIAAQGAAVNAALAVTVAPGGSIYGAIVNGPGAVVSASGPGTSAGTSVIASTTGFFQIFGLQNGAQYTIMASSASASSLSVSSAGVTATTAGTNVGALSFPAQGILEVSASLPLAAPAELFGSILAHTTGYAQTGSGPLHFLLGSASSDNGAQQFGQTASSWTQIPLPPGVYEVDVTLPVLNISTSVFGVTVAVGQTTSLAIALQKLANVYGYAFLPAAASTNVPVAVQAQLPGSAAPSVFGGAVVPIGLSSAVYSLFGLAPGSWTVTATAPGYVATSSALFVAGAADVGTASSGGFNISLSSQSSVLTGLLSVVGNTSALAPLNVPVYIDGGGTPALTVALATGASQTSSTFTITGLPDGSHTISASLNNYFNDLHSFTMAGGVGNTSLVLSPNQSNLVLTFKLPGGPHAPSDFAGVSYGLYGENFGQRGPYGPLYPAPLVANWMQYGVSSATLDLGNITADVTQVQAFYAGNGAYQLATIVVSPGATSYLTIDLSSPSYSVSGTLLLSQNLSLPQNGYAVNVSSIAGLLSNTATTGYCLIGSTTPQTASFAHLELLPQTNGAFANNTLPVAGPSGCVSQLLNMLTPPAAGASQPYWAYLSTVDVYGDFSFPSVPPGVYLLRNDPVIDSSGDPLPRFSQVVTVTASVSGLIFQLGSGNSISGSVLAPPGQTLTRQVFVSLMNAQGQLVAQAPAAFNGSGSAAYLFSQVAPGSYSIQVLDSSYPKAYAAVPLPVQMAGQSLSGQNLQLLPSGTIALRLAVQQNAPAGSGAFVLVTPFNLNLLPPGLVLEASADPWFNGGLAFAGGPSGSTVPVLDADGQFLIDGLLPGTYDIKLITPTGAAANASVSGLSVTPGGVSDAGVVNLAAAAQLSGQVLDAVSGQPLPGIMVEARPSSSGAGAPGQPVLTVTDVSGRFVIPGLSQAVRYYDVLAGFRGSEQQGETLPPYQQAADLSVDVTSAAVLGFSLARAPYSISGGISGTPGQPLNLPFPLGSSAGQGPQLGADVLLQRAGVAPVTNPIADIIFATDLNGNFTIPSLASGTYDLTVDALGYSYASQVLTITTASVQVGAIQLSGGASLSGSLGNPDGSYPSASQAAGIIAVGSTGGTLIGSLTTDPNTQGVDGYQISGFKVGPSYRVLILDSGGNFTSPPEASSLVFASTAAQTLNIVYRAVAPLAAAQATRQGSSFLIEYNVSQPLRNTTSADNNLPLLLSTVSAQGTLSQFALSADRTQLTAVYTPGVAESSFTLQLSAYSSVVNPGSLNPINPQYPIVSSTTFYVGIDGLGQSNIANFQGGNVVVSGDNGRVELPPSAFNLSASSSVQVTLQLAGEPLTGVGSLALRPGQTRLSALRYSPQAYPAELVAAVAAVPPDLNPLGPFYNIFLPIGINHALSAPSQLTLTYSSGTDPSTLNVYWYNSAANEYVLQPDVTGAAPVINPATLTYTINVNHFSTFVLFASNQSAIAGSSGASAFQAYNFPNPFDLIEKTVTTLHSTAGDDCNPSCSIRGTMISISVPPGISDNGQIDIFNVAGTKVKTIDAGPLTGGNFYYQNWDGTNDAGRDVASGVYIGELKVGGQQTFFKMAVIKGSGK